MHPLLEWYIVVFNVFTVKFNKFHGGAILFQSCNDRSKMSKGAIRLDGCKRIWVH